MMGDTTSPVSTEKPEPPVPKQQGGSSSVDVSPGFGRGLGRGRGRGVVSPGVGGALGLGRGRGRGFGHKSTEVATPLLEVESDRELGLPNSSLHKKHPSASKGAKSFRQIASSRLAKALDGDASLVSEGRARHPIPSHLRLSGPWAQEAFPLMADSEMVTHDSRILDEHALLILRELALRRLAESRDSVGGKVHRHAYERMSTRQLERMYSLLSGMRTVLLLTTGRKETDARTSSVGASRPPESLKSCTPWPAPVVSTATSKLPPKFPVGAVYHPSRAFGSSGSRWPPTMTANSVPCVFPPVSKMNLQGTTGAAADPSSCSSLILKESALEHANRVAPCSTHLYTRTNHGTEVLVQ